MKSEVVDICVWLESELNIPSYIFASLEFGRCDASKNT